MRRIVRPLHQLRMAPPRRKRLGAHGRAHRRELPALAEAREIGREHDLKRRRSDAKPFERSLVALGVRRHDIVELEHPHLVERDRSERHGIADAADDPRREPRQGNEHAPPLGDVEHALDALAPGQYLRPAELVDRAGPGLAVDRARDRLARRRRQIPAGSACCRRRSAAGQGTSAPSPRSG